MKAKQVIPGLILANVFYFLIKTSFYYFSSFSLDPYVASEDGILIFLNLYFLLVIPFIIKLDKARSAVIMVVMSLIALTGSAMVMSLTQAVFFVSAFMLGLLISSVNMYALILIGLFSSGFAAYFHTVLIEEVPILQNVYKEQGGSFWDDISPLSEQSAEVLGKKLKEITGGAFMSNELCQQLKTPVRKKACSDGSFVDDDSIMQILTYYRMKPEADRGIVDEVCQSLGEPERCSY